MTRRARNESDNRQYEIWFSMFYTHMIYFHKYKRYLDEISEIRQKHHFGKKMRERDKCYGKKNCTKNFLISSCSLLEIVLRWVMIDEWMVETR